MFIEKKYYTEQAKEMERLHREVEESKARLSPEEREKEKERLHAEADEIARRGEERLANSHHVINAERIKLFTALSVEVLYMAELLDLDVTIETKGTAGKVRLSTGCFLITRDCQDDVREIMATLIKSADDVWVRKESEDGRDLVTMEFMFNLAMRVEKGV